MIDAWVICRLTSNDNFTPQIKCTFVTTVTSTLHYNDVIMCAMESQITGVSIVCWNRLFRRRPKKTSKHRVAGLCEGNPPVDSPHKGKWRGALMFSVISTWTCGFTHKYQWSGALMFSLVCAWTNGSANNQDASDLRLHRAHYDVTLMNNSLCPPGNSIAINYNNYFRSPSRHSSPS